MTAAGCAAYSGRMSRVYGVHENDAWLGRELAQVDSDVLTPV